MEMIFSEEEEEEIQTSSSSSSELNKVSSHVTYLLFS